MTEQNVQFPSGDLTLEGVWHLAESKGDLPAVVVCHPHPLYGGNMDNGVVVLVCRYLARRGINAFRFNFRGTGGSQGAFGGGVSEQNDLRAALSYVLSAKFVDGTKTGICGYSFGAGVALSVAAAGVAAQALAAISPPLFSDYHGLEAFQGHKLFLGGSRDDLFPAQALSHFVEGLPEPHECEIIPGADHFWMGYEKTVAGKAADFFARVLHENN
ncbi:MAG: dienelactone hydrolase family protein [Chloroflexi bacterium]|nr:dienelactone hydrolase family protein [Chloroflexota bacterium]